jgi:hypothetical protein
MLAGMAFGRFTGVMCRMKRVPLSDMRVVRRFLVIAGFMVRSSFTMMRGCLFVVFRRLLVVLGNFVGCSESPVCSCYDEVEIARGRPKELALLTRSRIGIYSGFVTP